MAYLGMLGMGRKAAEYIEGETVIGTFLGKTLYRRVWKVNITVPGQNDNPNYVTYVVNDFNPARIISLKATYKSYLNFSYVMCSPDQAGGGSFYWAPEGNKFLFSQKVTNDPGTITAIICEYTKEDW